MPTINSKPKLYTEYIATPWCIKLELSRGCNLRCSFCPVSTDESLQSKSTWEFMEPRTLQEFCHSYNEMRLIHSPNSWPRIELALRGEPLLNPQVEECLMVIRDLLPMCQITMFSNGTQLLKDDTLLNRVFDAGLNILYIDCYNNTYSRFETHCNKVKRDSIGVFDAKDLNPYRIHKNGHKLTAISLIVGLEDQENSLSVRKIHNMGGNVEDAPLIQLGWKKPKDLPLQKNCTKPHRDIVCYSDGNIITCCLDWYPTEATILGNIFDNSVEEIWYGKKHLQILRQLWSKDRNFGLCSTCSYAGGYRFGFLQDPNIEKV